MDATFSFVARIVRWIDADTVLVDPSIYREDIHLRVRLRDVWAPEIGEDGHDAALFKAVSTLGDVGDEVRLTGDRARWTFGRLVARVDRAV